MGQMIFDRKREGDRVLPTCYDQHSPLCISESATPSQPELSDAPRASHTAQLEHKVSGQFDHRPRMCKSLMVTRSIICVMELF